MSKTIDMLLMKMASYERNCPQRMQHLLKVHAFAALIGRSCELNAQTQETLEIASVLHDIGIKPSLEKYGSSQGKYQEMEGPFFAEKMLEDLPVQKETIARVKYLIAHHHTYFSTEEMDLRILWEADFLVNLFEGKKSKESAENAYREIFQTECGKTLCEEMFLKG